MISIAKICLVCASGGHLTEMLRLNEAFIDHDSFLITYGEEFLDRPDPAKIPPNITQKYFIENYMVGSVRKSLPGKIFRLISQLIVVSGRELLILMKEKPDVIISTGSGIAIPIFYYGRLMGKKLIFIESLCRVKDISHTGKIVIPIIDYFIVQWEPLTKQYEGTVFKGNLLESGAQLWGDVREKEEDFIFVPVGTSSFSRLIRKMDEIAGKSKMKIVMQIGRSDYEPKNSEFFRFTEYNKFISYIERAKIIVMHPGAGTLITTLGLGKKPIVVARSQEYGECLDDDQNEIVRILAKENRIDLARTIDEIPILIDRRIASSNPENRINTEEVKEGGLIDYIRSILSSKKDFDNKG